jgi:hypothetical protein
LLLSIFCFIFVVSSKIGAALFSLFHHWL